MNEQERIERENRARVSRALAEIKSEQRYGGQKDYAQMSSEYEDRMRVSRALAQIEEERQAEELSGIKTTYGASTKTSTAAIPKSTVQETPRRSIVSAEDRRKYNDYKKVSSRERMEWQKEVREHGDGTPAKKDSTNAASRNIHGIQSSSNNTSNENSIQGVKIASKPDQAEEEKKRRKQSVKAIKQEEARMREIGRQLEAEDKYYQMSPDAQKQLDYIIEAEEESDAQKWAGILSAFAGTSGGTNAIAASSAMSNAQNAKDKLRQEYGMTDADIDTMALIHKRMKSAEAAEKRDSRARKFADDHGATASGVSIPASVFGGLLGIAGIGDSYLDVQKGKALGLGDIGLDTNDKYNTFRSYSGSIRDEVKQNNNWMIGDYDAFDFLYDTGMSGFDSLAASAFGSVGGAIALGAGAATDTAMDLAARGVSSEKAIAGGIAAGTFETLFEKVSLGNLRAFKEVSAKSAKDVAKNIVKTTFVNASEEFTTEVANIVYDYVANGNLSNAQLMMQELTSQGMDEDAAKKEVFKRLGLQAVEAGAGGALMGFAFGAGGTAYNQAARANYTRAIGREIKHSGDAGSTIAEGKAAPQGSAAYEAAVKAEKRATRHGGKFGDYSVGKSALENADIYMQAAAEIDGRFKNDESAAELKESYDALKQTTRSKKELRALDKEYKSANALLETRETAKQMRAAADDFAQKKLDARTKVEMTNPEIEVDGEKKTVERIDKVNRETGEITVKTTSGESVPLSTASVTDKRAAKLYEAAKDYSAEEARLFAGNYSNDVDIKYYKKAFDWFRNMGRAGADVEQVRKLDNAWGSYFTPEAQEQIVKAGAVNREFRQGVTDLSLVDSKNNRQYKLEKQVLEGMTKAFNTEIIIVDSYTNSKGEATNGFYMRDKNRIVIARNADGNLLLRTAGHELYHHVENYAAEQAQQLSDYVISALREKGVDIDKALEKYGSSYAEDKHVSELVADSMFDVFMDEKFVRRFTAKYSSLSGKIISRLREIVSNMKNTLKVLATNGRHVEISALSDDVEKLETIRQMLVDGAKRAGENFAAKQAENKKTAESAVESGDGSLKDKFSYNSLTSKPDLKIVEVSNSAAVPQKSDGRIDFQKLMSDIRGKCKVLNDKSGAPIYYVEVEDIDRKVQIVSRGISHGMVKSISKAKAKQGREMTNAIASIELPKILENSIEVNRLSSRNEENLYSHVLLGVAQWKNDKGQIETYAVRSIVDEKKNSEPVLAESNIICRLYASNAKKIANASDNVSMQSISTYSEDSPTISIADVLENVKDNFDDTFSDDVYSHFGVSRVHTNFSKDLQFSLKDSVEEKGELIAVHNLSEDKLLKSLQLGGLPMPSIAVLKAKEGHPQYGEISLVFDKSTIDPQRSSANKIYSGDAWTPTYPSIEYKPNEEVADRVRDKYYELYRKHGNEVTRPLYAYANDTAAKLNDEGGEAGIMSRLADDAQMMNLFQLDTTGKKTEPVYTETKTEISQEQRAEYDRIIEALGDETVKAIITPPGESPATHKKEFLKANNEALSRIFPQDMKPFAMAAKVRKAADYLINGSVKVSEELDYAATEKAIREATNESDYMAWLHRLFDGIEEKTGIRNQKDMFDKNGNRRSFEALHWENSLENVVKAMKEDVQKGGTSLFSGVGIWGVSTKEFNNIDEVKADADRLINISDEENAAIKQGFGARLDEIAQKIVDNGADNPMIALDNAYANIVDAVRNCDTREDMLAYLKQYAPKATAATVDEIISLVNDISEMPARYFEAKPQRAVKFDEVVKAIVPDNISDELRSALEEAGVTVAEYVAGDEQSRLERLNEDEDVMFSKKEHDPDLAYYGEVITENRIFRQIYASLGDLYSGVREDIHLDNKDIDRVSRKILKQTHSGYSSTQLSKELTAVYDYMSSAKQTGNFDEDLVLDRLVGIARNVIEKSTSIDSELWEQYADAREWLKKTTLYISPELKAEIASNYGDYRTYRNLLFNKANLNTQDSHAMALDEAWGQLHELAPEYFPTDISDKDMPMQLAAFFDAIKKRSVNPYEQTTMSIEEEATLLASQLFSEYFNVGTLKSDKEKYRGLVYNNMQATKELRSELRREFNRRNAQNREDYRKEYVNRVAEFKKAKERSESRKKTMRSINRTYKYLSRRLNNETDYVHIPEELKPLARAYTHMLPASYQHQFGRMGILEVITEYSKLLEGASEKVKSKYEGMFSAEILAQLNGFCERNVSGEGDNARFRDLTDMDLKIVENIGDHVRHLVSSGNEMFADNIKEKVSTIAKQTHDILEKEKDSSVQELPEGHSKFDKAKQLPNQFKYELMMPQYLFESISGENGPFAQLYKNLRNGENVQASIVAEAREKVREIKQKNHYDELWRKKAVTIDAIKIIEETGEELPAKLTMSVEQTMSLYATIKREQGKEHVFYGGFYIAKKENSKASAENSKSKRVANSIKDFFGVKVTRAHYRLNPETGLKTVSDALTLDQRNYVDDMVAYITNDIGSRRNDVSLKLYGIKRYLESYYFPITTDDNYLDTPIGRNRVEQTIKNQSSSKRTVKHASNPVIISEFTNKVNHHIYDSSLYCAYVLPLADIKRVYNYREKSVNEAADTGVVSESLWSVKNDLTRKKGIKAVEQIEKFLHDVDSGQSSTDLTFPAEMMTLAKKAAVMGNLSVVVQQPTAVFRAMLYVDPKYFANVASKADIAEMKKYNGCALVKEIGYFDVNMGRNAIDYINEYSADKAVKAERSTMEKMSMAKEKAMPKIDEITGWAAGKADEITWGCIWNACKKQTAAQNKGLSGDELNAKAAELFQNVIGKTQVYDSVFTKCDLLRRKTGFALMTMQFMSEPVTTLNMLYESVSNARKSDAPKDAVAKCGRAFACYLTSLVVNSAIKSVVYAVRDDDDDKSFWEKYLGTAASGIASDVTDLIPYIKDVMSVAKGYDVSRLDLAAFGSLADAVKACCSDKREPPEKVLSVLKAVGQFTGVPVYNITRDFFALLNTCDKIKNCLTGKKEYQPTTATGVLEAIKANTSKSDSPYKQLYDAKNNGDVAHYQKVYGNLRRGGNIYGQRHRDSVDTSTINTQVRQVIKDEYMADEIDRTTALQRLREWPGKNDKADAAEKRIAAWDEEKQAKKSEKS